MQPILTFRKAIDAAIVQLIDAWDGDTKSMYKAIRKYIGKDITEYINNVFFD